MSLSFTEEYFPDIAAVSPTELATARDMVVRILQPAMPDVDLAPGTPTGDLAVSVLAAFRAASETANSRLMSDINLENAANGLIYSCAFVRAYLGNFGVYDVENLRATGLVRLTFTSPAARELPLAIRFRFGNVDTYSLAVTNADTSAVTLLAAGTPHNGNADTYVLSQTSISTWAVDVPLTGNLTLPVARGTAGTATIVSADLIGIASAIDFQAGVPSASLGDLARMARKAAFSLTAGGRSSTSSLILRNWPETVMVSPVVTGDVEMVRAPLGSAMVMQRPSIDAYIRSARDMQRETQVVKLTYVPGSPGKFRGALNLLHTPSRIVSVEWSGSTTVSAVTSFTVFTASARPDLYWGQHCGTRFENLFVEVIPTDAVERSNEPDTDPVEQYAMFTVVYDADPLTGTIAAALESSDNTPPGVSVLVKNGPLVLLDSLTVFYTKKQGVRTTLSVAQKQIADYLRTAGHPDVFRQTAIHDIMVDSGAERVTAITCSGGIRLSAASRRFIGDITDPGGAGVTDDWDADSFEMTIPPVTSVSEIVPNEIIDVEVDGNIERWGATGRTVRYHVDVANVTFTEVH